MFVYQQQARYQGNMERAARLLYAFNAWSVFQAKFVLNIV